MKTSLLQYQQTQVALFAIGFSTYLYFYVKLINSYNSLYFSSHNDTESLFIHVPPFEVFPEEVQLKFVKRAIELCANSVLNK